MAVAQSKVTAQGRIPVPAEMRRKLGLVPGSVLEWDELGSEVVVRKASRHASADVHRSLFGDAGTPLARSAVSIDDAIRTSIRKRHARD